MSLKNFSDDEINRLYTDSIDGFKRGNYGNSRNITSGYNTYEDYVEQYGISKANQARGEINYDYYHDGGEEAENEGWMGVRNSLGIKNIDNPSDLNQMLAAVRNEYYDRKSGASNKKTSEEEIKKEDTNTFYKPQDVAKPTFLYEDSSTEERISPYREQESAQNDKSEVSPYEEYNQHFSKARNRSKNYLSNANKFYGGNFKPVELDFD